MTAARKYPCVSTHETLFGSISVDWERDYRGGFQCPYCGSSELGMRWIEQRKHVRVNCKSCKRETSLQHKCLLPCISEHETLYGTIRVNWRSDYRNEFQCPFGCGSTQLYFYHPSPQTFRVECQQCDGRTTLSCSVQRYIYNYEPGLSCPNPACLKNWIYKTAVVRGKQGYCCHDCGVQFCNSDSPLSWTGREQPIISFNLDDDKWDMRNFFEHPRQRNLVFTSIRLHWYKNIVKQYLYTLIKAKGLSDGTLQATLTTLKLFGKIISEHSISSPEEIQRSTILSFLSIRHGIGGETICSNLSSLSQFFNWLRLNTQKLIYRRDYPKQRSQEPDWIEEAVRKAIQQNLDKIPAPIFRQYRIQLHIAARHGDAGRLPFDCLIEENNRWYIQFFQGKVKREHRVPATREIRRLIEEQKIWIRKTFDSNYPYLFCHFWNVRVESYPAFSSMQPLPEPPTSKGKGNAMVKIIRIMIAQENILDSNGKLAYFTGKITRSTRLQEVREKHGIEVARVYADHKSATTTLLHYAPPTREQVAKVDLPFQALLINEENRFLPWQSLPESLLKNPAAHELDIEISPRLAVYGHCGLEDPSQPCPKELYPTCYNCRSFRPSTGKLPLYERQYINAQNRIAEAEIAGAEIVYEEAKSIIKAMDRWLPDLRRLSSNELETRE